MEEAKLAHLFLRKSNYPHPLLLLILATLFSALSWVNVMFILPTVFFLLLGCLVIAAQRRLAKLLSPHIQLLMAHVVNNNVVSHLKTLATLMSVAPLGTIEFKFAYALAVLRAASFNQPCTVNHQFLCPHTKKYETINIQYANHSLILRVLSVPEPFGLLVLIRAGSEFYQELHNQSN